MPKTNKGALIVALKFLTVVSLYMAASGMLLAFLHSTANTFVSVGIILFFTMLSYTLRNIRFVWILPLILSTSAFFYEFFVNSGLFVNLLWIFPVYIYGFVFNTKKLYFSDKYQNIKTSNILMALIWIVPVLGITGSGLSKTIGGDNGSEIFGLLFLVSGMLLMRYSRHKNISVDNREFNFINLEAVILLFATAAVSAAAVVGLYYGITGLMLWFAGLFHKRPALPLVPSPTAQPVFSGEAVYEGVKTPAPVTETAERNGESKVIGIVLIAVILGVLLYIIIMKLKKSGDFADGKPANAEKIREKSEKKRKHGESHHAYSNRMAVRRCYRKFMQLCIDNHIDITQSMTAREVCDAAVKVGFSPDECDALCRIYTLARYSSADISDKDAKTAVALYNAVRKRK